MNSSSPSEVREEIESSRPQQSTDVSSSASIDTSTEVDAEKTVSTPGQGAVHHIEGSKDAASDAPTSADLNSADNGDGLGAPAKTDKEVPTTDSAQVQMNGPV